MQTILNAPVVPYRIRKHRRTTVKEADVITLLNANLLANATSVALDTPPMAVYISFSCWTTHDQLVAVRFL